MKLLYFLNGRLSKYCCFFYTIYVLLLLLLSITKYLSCCIWVMCPWCCHILFYVILSIYINICLCWYIFILILLFICIICVIWPSLIPPTLAICIVVPSLASSVESLVVWWRSRAWIKSLIVYFLIIIILSPLSQCSLSTTKCNDSNQNNTPNHWENNCQNYPNRRFTIFVCIHIKCT